MFRKKKNIIDLNQNSPKELRRIAESYVREYHDNRNKKGIFKELNKIEEVLIYMRDSQCSLDWIKKYILDETGYKVGIHTLSEWYKVFHTDKPH
jgi:CHAD domain-containing protein